MEPLTHDQIAAVNGLYLLCPGWQLSTEAFDELAAKLTEFDTNTLRKVIHLISNGRGKFAVGVCLRRLGFVSSCARFPVSTSLSFFSI